MVGWTLAKEGASKREEVVDITDNGCVCASENVFFCSCACTSFECHNSVRASVVRCCYNMLVCLLMSTCKCFK